MEISSEAGIKSIVATPHFYPDQMKIDEFLAKREEAASSLAKFCFEAKARGAVLPDVFVGAEVAYFKGIARSDAVRRLCVLGTDLILVEMPFEKWTDGVVDEMILMADMPDVTPVIAHFERYIPYQNKGRIKKMIDAGLLIQCNGEAFLDPDVKKYVEKLMNAGNVDLLGSDCHDLLNRRPELDLASARIAKTFGIGALEAVNKRGQELLRNAQKII